MYYCFFEQSGTFKKQLKKLGKEAIDIDIENKFNETDIQIDIFQEIEKEINEEKSIFNNIKEEDTIIAFFPCIKFENQFNLIINGTQHNTKEKTEEQKIIRAIKEEKERARLYELFGKLILIAKKRKFKLIIENPYSTQHYLVRYFPIKAKIIDMDRRKTGDIFKKPTQYWFINREPSCNMSLKYQTNENKNIHRVNGFERNIISELYAERFIKDFII